MSNLRQLASFVASLDWDAVPDGVQERTRVRVLDVAGVSLAARDSPVALKSFALAARDPQGPSSYWLTGKTGSVEGCAFVNSILAHAILQEDVGQGGHPASNVVPAAFAVAEAEARGGRELLAAVAAGYEVQARLGAGDLLHAIGDRGLRGTTATGCFGAAAAAARLLRLPGERVASALALAASLCVPGIEQPLLVGSDERSLHVAANTRNGVLCALLARDGFDGASSALAGEAGFFAVYGGVPGDRPEVVAGLGETWVSQELVFKPYPTAGWNVGPIYATLALIEEHAVRAGDVDHVEVLHTWWHRNHAYIFPGPFTTLEQALISCNFAVACALVHGRYDWDTVKIAWKDPVVAELATRISVDGVATWGFTDGAVTLMMRDGTRLTASAEEIPRELVQPRWDEAAAKFDELTAFLPGERRRVIINTIVAADASTDLLPLHDALRAPA